VLVVDRLNADRQVFRPLHVLPASSGSVPCSRKTVGPPADA
jgi:hypothetical protein